MSVLDLQRASEPNLVLEDVFYPGETGFAFSIITGLDMTDLALGEIKGVIKRPNGSIANRTIPLTSITDAATGTVDFDILETDFTEIGFYFVQVFIKDVTESISRPSHIAKFEVVAGVADPLDVFA